MHERDLLRAVYDEKYAYVLNSLIKEISDQNKIISKQNDIIKSLEDRLNKIEKLNKVTHTLVEPLKEEQDKSLNDILEEFANSEKKSWLFESKPL